MPGRGMGLFLSSSLRGGERILDQDGPLHFRLASEHGQRTRTGRSLAPPLGCISVQGMREAEREHHCADAMSRLPTLALDRSVIPEDVPCFSLAEYSRGWVAFHYGELYKEQPVTLACMIAAQKDVQRCQDSRDEMDQNEHLRFYETKEGLLVRVTPLDGATQVCVPYALRRDLLQLDEDVVRAGHPSVQIGRTPRFGATTTGNPWPRTCTTALLVLRLVSGPGSHQGGSRRCSRFCPPRYPSRACKWTTSGR